MISYLSRRISLYRPDTVEYHWFKKKKKKKGILTRLEPLTLTFER